MSKNLRMTASDVLLAAADAIQQRGLAKEVYEDSRGRFCSLGALFHVFGNVGGCELPNALARLSLHLSPGTYDDFEARISAWSDSINTTEDDVIQAMHDTARRVK